MKSKKEIKEILDLNKHLLMKLCENQATYENWDGHSPIYAYDKLKDKAIKITDISLIKLILTSPSKTATEILLGIDSTIIYFFSEEEMKTYKWFYEMIMSYEHRTHDRDVRDYFVYRIFGSPKFSLASTKSIFY